MTTPLPSVIPSPLNDRVLGRVRGVDDGPTIVCIGGLHGNEPTGVVALERLFVALESRPGDLRGEAVALAGNLGALAEGRRYLDEDLNRIWDKARVGRLRSGASPGSREEHELAELDTFIRRLEEDARGPLFLLDLHTTSAPGPGFLIADKNPGARQVTSRLPVPEVEGLGTILPGTFLYHLANDGFAAMAFECGQHDDPASPARAEAAVWTVLEAVGVIPPGTREAAEGRSTLHDEHSELPKRVRVFYRHPVTPEDLFAMNPGFQNFQPVRCDEPLGRDRQGQVRASRDGLILMPLYQPVGEDGFFLAHTI